MSEVIGSGRIEIDVDDKSALSALRKVESEFERTMNRIDREEATVTVDADTRKFDSNLNEAQRKIRAIERKKSVTELRLETSQYEDALKKAKLELKKLEGQHAEVVLREDKQAAKKLAAAIKKAKLDVKSFDGMLAEATLDLKFNEAEFKAAEARLKAIEDRTRAVEKITEAAHREQERRVRKEQQWREKVARTSESLWKQQLREMTQAEQAAHRMEMARNREAAQREREIAALPRLRSQYAGLAHTIEKLNEARRKVRRDPDASIRVDLAIADAEAQMQDLKKRLKKAGEDPPVVVNIRPGVEFGAALRHTIGEGLRDRGVRGAAMNAGVLVGRDMAAGIVNGVKNNLTPRALMGGIGGILGGIGRKLGGLSEMTVRIGPFTATIRQAFTALAILGPLLVDIVGAFGSLIGVLGSATLGFAALTAGLVGGAIPALAGMGFVIKDVVQEFGAVKKATKAHADAVMKHGKNSDQAAKKMKELKNVMGSVSDTTLKQIANAQKMGAAWDKATKRARGDVWKGIGNALEAANKMLPMFAKNTNESMRVAEQSTSRWTKALSSPEGMRVVNRLMDNFRRSLGPILDGLGALVGYFGKVGAEASKFLPGMARQFRDWAQGINETADGSAEFKDKVDNLVQSTKNLGAFLMATGRLMKAFFGGGVDAGQSFLVTMTETMNRWTAFLNTTEGQTALRDFFRESVEGAKSFWRAIVPIIKSFVDWAILMAPVVRRLMDVFGAITKVVGGLLEITALRSSLSALVATLAILWGIGKIRAATNAIYGFTTALTRMGRAQKAAAAAGAVAPAAGAAGGAAAAGAGVGAGAAAGAAGATLGKRLLGGLTGLLKKAGPVGIAIGLGDAIIKSVDIIGQRQTFAGKFNALADNIFNSFTFGLTKSADEKTAAAFKKVRESIMRNADAQIPKNILNDVLTKQQVDLIPTLRSASRAAAEFIRTNKLPSFKAKVELGGEQAFKDALNRITANFGLMKSKSFGTLREIKAVSQQNFRDIASTMGTNSAAGRAAVERNFSLTARAIIARLTEGKTSTRSAMAAIRSSFITNSQGSRKSAEVNFAAAAAAIQSAVRKGRISSATGLREIHKLWVAALKTYGYTAPEAIALATSPDRGASKPGLSKKMPGNARGGLNSGLKTVGRAGVAGRDNVPAMLNGKPAVVAEGENVAVFNRHQRKQLDQRLADQGGLAGFFARNRKPHYMASGGIVELGREIQSKGYHVSEHPAFGGVNFKHAPNGWHYKAGALDVNADNFPGGEMPALDKLASWLISKGWNVLWRVADHFDHLHVDIGKGGTAGGMGGMPNIDMPKLKRQIAAKGLGAMTALSQRALDTALGAAQSNIEKVHEATMFADMGEGSISGATAGSKENMSLGRRMMSRFWGGDQWPALRELWTRESNWNNMARNPSSGAFGIPQALPPTKMPAAAQRGDAGSQIGWGLRYIKERYGSPAAALAFHDRKNWYARGGVIPALIGDGAAPEYRIDTATGKGSKTNGPQITTLKPTEAVIPTEKRMRGRGLGILKDVARDLGVEAFRGGTPAVQNTRGTNRGPGRSTPKVQPNYRGLAYEGATGASKNLGRAPARVKAPKKVNRGSSSFRSRRSKAYQSGRGYVRYIGGLKNAQEDWEREVNFRESQVREPEDLLIEQGRITVYNPETKQQEDVGPKMVPNEQGIADYKTDLASVQDAFKMLIQVIQTIIAEIPNALQAINVEEIYRNANIKNLKSDIALHERVIEARGRGKVDKKDRGIIARHTKKKEQAEAELQHEEGVLGTLKEDRRTLKEDRKEAHWDLRETEPQAAKNWAEHEGVSGRAAEMAATANADTTAQGIASMPPPPDNSLNGGGGAGGDAGDTGPTMAQQETMLNNARLELYKQFGGNTSPAALSAAGASLSGDQGGSRMATAMASSANGSGAAGANQAVNGTSHSTNGGVAEGGSGQASSAQGGSDKQVNINQTFYEMPDPHTWSTGVKYEMQAAY